MVIESKTWGALDHTVKFTSKYEKNKRENDFTSKTQWEKNYGEKGGFPYLLLFCEPRIFIGFN